MASWTVRGQVLVVCAPCNSYEGHALAMTCRLLRHACQVVKADCCVWLVRFWQSAKLSLPLKCMAIMLWWSLALILRFQLQIEQAVSYAQAGKLNRLTGRQLCLLCNHPQLLRISAGSVTQLSVVTTNRDGHSAYGFWLVEQSGSRWIWIFMYQVHGCIVTIAVSMFITDSTLPSSGTRATGAWWHSMQLHLQIRPFWGAAILLSSLDQ